MPLLRDGPAAAAALYRAEVVDALALVATPTSLPAAIERFAALGIDELACTLTGDLDDMLTATNALGQNRLEAIPAEAGGRL